MKKNSNGIQSSVIRNAIAQSLTLTNVTQQQRTAIKEGNFQFQFFLFSIEKRNFFFKKKENMSNANCHVIWLKKKGNEKKNCRHKFFEKFSLPPSVLHVCVTQLFSCVNKTNSIFIQRIEIRWSENGFFRW